MIETSHNPSLTESPVTRILWIFLIAVTLGVCYFSQLEAVGLVGPDEPRYAWIARAMAESGDWVTPRLYGVPWFEKPVLYYWEAAVSFKMFGVSEAAARLPSAISALIATLALGWLAWRVYGVATARWFLILLPSSVGMIGFSHAAATDMPFAGMISVAMVCAAVVLGLERGADAEVTGGIKDDAEIGVTSGRAGAQHAAPLQNPAYRIVALGLFGVFLGLAVLAKGPAGIVLCGGGVFFWAIFTGRWRDAFRLLHPVAILAFCITALPWYVICARRNPDFFRIFIIEHNFKRYLTPEFQHVQPFWYYVPVLLVAFLPWIGLFLWSAIVGTKESIRRGGASNPTLFLICWAGFCVVFFSASHSKLPGYVLPAFPAIGLLMARVSNKMGLPRRVSFRIAHFVAAAGFLAVVTVLELLANAHGFGGAKFAAHVTPLMLLFALANGIAGMFAGWARFRRGGIAAALAVIPVLASVLLANVLVAPFFRWDPSGRAISKEVERQRIPPGMLAVTNMKRGQQYSLSFYLHDEIKDWNPASKTGGYLLTGSKNCEAVVGAGFYCEAQPFDLDRTGRFLYLVIPIAGEKTR